MRIEILVDNEDPQIFPLNKPKIVIGSHESCDVILNAEGISRKHLIISSEDDNYFAIDQGSTNGSYVNEERLVPGRKVEFTSFFPLRLGDNVLVSLLSDEDANDLGFIDPGERKDPTSPRIDTSSLSDATRTISLKDLQSGNTAKLQQKRHVSVAKRKIQKAAPSLPEIKDKSRMLFVKIFSGGLLLFAAYYNFYVLNSEEPVEPVKINKVGEEVIAQAPLKPRFAVVDDLDFTPKSRFDDISKGLSCTSDLEKYLCEKFSTRLIGVIQSGTMVHLFLNGADYYEKAKELLSEKQPLDKATSPAAAEKIHDDLKLVALILFINSEVPKDLDYSLLKDVNLTFAIQFPVDNKSPEYVPAVFIPATLSLFLRDFNPDSVKLAKRHGAGVFYYLKDYFKTY